MGSGCRRADQSVVGPGHLVSPETVLANLAKRDITQLTALVKTRLRRMQYQRGLLEGLLAGIRLDLTPLCNPRS